MSYFSEALAAAFRLIIQFDRDIFFIVWTSLKIAFVATISAGIGAIVLGILATVSDFHGKRILQHLLNTLSAMPTVMIGLILYGLLNRRGPFGEYELLYTQTAVIIGEACLIFPIIMNMTMVGVQSADRRLVNTLKMLGASPIDQIFPIISELRFILLTAIITGFGRAIGEVGAAMMLGGNIQGSTRTITTAIALETGKGDFEMGLALGILLLSIAFLINLALQMLPAKPGI
ncbi:ABC transporter permease [Methylotuvimicrobium alcaliphilum]|uniref:ABC transporter, permease protein n=1 Tax=Methylotuvimicrobium alcaliphilum (strain DSM 19304 / NCIMB 14124 / VKM B-2133 / 20Z) TaxID=1091494 RepID=G4STI8_META2|nr:ABC transporter permease [Methylotuvimicrobium alcaliphilum]CCE24986.1 putative ABC transporter, permease protein [Methylotuvimicrobium alcaliphilum 20Z]